MKQSFIYLLLILFVLSCTSYEKDDQLTDVENAPKGITLSLEKHTISVDDAITVAQMFNSGENGPITKVANKVVSDTQTIETTN